MALSCNTGFRYCTASVCMSNLMHQYYLSHLAGILAFDKICNLSTHLQSEYPLDDVHVVCRFPWLTNLCYHFPFVVCMCKTPRPKHKPAFTGSSRTAQAACMSARAKRRHTCTLRKGIWAARSYTGPLVKLMPKGVVFSSFLFLRKGVFCRGC